MRIRQHAAVTGYGNGDRAGITEYADTHPDSGNLRHPGQHPVDPHPSQNQRLIRTGYIRQHRSRLQAKAAQQQPLDRCRLSHGEVHVETQVVGFKKIKFFTMENVGAGELQLPQQEMHTTGFWLTVKNDVLQSLDFANEEKIEAIAGIAYLVRQISPVILLCDARDLGVAIEDNLTKEPLQPGAMVGNANLRSLLRSPVDPDFADRFEPNIFIFDKYPGGVGLSETLYEKGGLLLEKALEIIAGCPCPTGCPSCVGPAIRAGGDPKAAARFILKLLLERLDN